MDKRIQGFETELHVCSVVRNKARVERARNFFGITHVGDLTAVRDVGFGAKKGGELGGRTDAGVMSSHNPPNRDFHYGLPSRLEYTPDDLWVGSCNPIFSRRRPW